MLGEAQHADRVVSVQEQIREYEAPEREPWDGIGDALDPVRQLVSGPEALVPPSLYNQLRLGTHRVLAHVSPLSTERTWAFLAVGASADGAPRWLFFDGPDLIPAASLERTCARLREELSSDPPSHNLDDDALTLLDKALHISARHEFAELPRRMRCALEQMSTVLPEWAVAAQGAGDETAGQQLQKLAALAGHDGEAGQVDPYLLAGRWLSLVSPVLDARRRPYRRHRPFVLMRDITPQLITQPLPTTEVIQALSDLPDLVPIAERVTSCILGLPAVGRVPRVSRFTSIRALSSA